jgi:hypothetical protein
MSIVIEKWQLSNERWQQNAMSMWQSKAMKMA